MNTKLVLAMAGIFMVVGILQDSQRINLQPSPEYSSTDPQGYLDYYKMRRGPDFHPSDVVRGFEDTREFYLKTSGSEGIKKDAGLKSWTWKGPGNIGGRVRALVVKDNGSGEDELFAGSAGGGIIHSTNGGASWTFISDFLPSLIVTSIAIDPTNDNRMFASTGDGFGGAASAPGGGIMFSVDGGEHWGVLPGTSEWYYINKVIIDPHDPATLYAVRTLEDSELNRLNFGRIEKSTTAGLTWEDGWDTSGSALDVEVDPVDPENVIVGTANGLYRSQVVGDEWDFVEEPSMQNLGRVEIAFAPSTISRVYALTETNNGSFYHSLDGGETWTLRSSTTDMGPTMWHYNSLFIDPDSPTKIIAGGLDIYRSLDAGITFDSISDWRDFHDGSDAHADNHIFVPSINYSASNPVVYVGNDGGVQRIDDIWTESFGDWHNLANTSFGVTQFYGADAKNDGSLFIGGTQDNSFCFGSNTGDWIQTTTGDGAQAEVNYLDEAIMYVNLNNQSIRKTTDGGTTWSTIASLETTQYCSNNPGNPCCQTGGPGLDGTPCIDDQEVIRIDDNAPLISEFIMDPDDPTVLYAGANNLWKITDAPSGRTVSLLTGGPGNVSTIAAADNGQTIWVGFTSTSLQASFDAGNTWSAFDNVINLDIYSFTDIAIDPLNSDRVLVSKGGYRLSNLYLIEVINNSPAQSTSMDISLPFPMQVNSVAFHPTRSGWIYIGTDVGIFASEDLGTTWSMNPIFDNIQGDHPNEGPIYSIVEELFWYGDGSVDKPYHLGAATFGRGIWATTFPLYSHLYVDRDYTGPQTGSFTQPFNTLEQAVNRAAHGVTIVFKSSGQHDEPVVPIVMDTRGTIQVSNGTVVVQ